jgi:acetate kinase
LPTVRHMACFDTDFGWALPALSARLPIPERYAQRGLRRYGFHGLSYEYLLRTYSRTLGSRAVIAHLGSGSSVVAVRDGKPVDTSMALTPLGGVVMSTRSGDLDPGVVCAMARADGNIDATEYALAYGSGLRALSGTTGDLADLVRVASSDDAARLAVEAYVVSVAKVVAGFITVLGGLDSMLFTGGVGVHNATVRSAIIERLGALHLTFEAHFVPTDEERMMAWHALHALSF